jgi:hypothetical protein
MDVPITVHFGSSMLQSLSPSSPPLAADGGKTTPETLFILNDVSAGAQATFLGEERCHYAVYLATSKTLLRPHDSSSGWRGAATPVSERAGRRTEGKKTRSWLWRWRSSRRQPQHIALVNISGHDQVNMYYFLTSWDPRCSFAA